MFSSNCNFTGIQELLDGVAKTSAYLKGIPLCRLEICDPLFFLLYPGPLCHTFFSFLIVCLSKFVVNIPNEV